MVKRVNEHDDHSKLFEVVFRTDNAIWRTLTRFSSRQIREQGNKGLYLCWSLEKIITKNT